MVQGVVVTNFITLSNASKEAFKTATLLKTLNVNSLITGEDGVGKKSLASYILPNATMVDASDFDESLTALNSANQIILTNLHNSPNLNTIIETINSNDIRVVATSKEYLDNENLDELFSVKFSIPPLAQREEDVVALIDMFSKEATDIFGGESEFNSLDFTPDLSKNTISLSLLGFFHNPCSLRGCITKVVGSINKKTLLFPVKGINKPIRAHFEFNGHNWVVRI